MILLGNFLFLCYLIKLRNMLFFYCIWNWCSCFCYCCGYGVYFLFDFFLIIFVVYEKYYYYVYWVLKERGFFVYLLYYWRKVNCLLFWLVNYFRLKLLIEVGIGNGVFIGYMWVVCYIMDFVILKGRDWVKIFW